MFRTGSYRLQELEFAANRRAGLDRVISGGPLRKVELYAYGVLLHRAGERGGALSVVKSRKMLRV